MKTIAFTIDEDTLERLDRLPGNRSKLIREAVREHLARRERVASEQQEARIVHQHRGRLARQARALIRSPAVKPIAAPVPRRDAAIGKNRRGDFAAELSAVGEFLDAQKSADASCGPVWTPRGVN